MVNIFFKDKQIDIDQNLCKNKKKMKIDDLIMYFDNFFRKIVYIEYIYILKNQIFGKEIRRNLIKFWSHR